MPRLQAPKRGPQICALVVAIAVVGLLFGSLNVSGELFGTTSGSQNATWPTEVRRTRAVASAIQSGVVTRVTETGLNDLVVAVGYLLDRLSAAR